MHPRLAAQALHRVPAKAQSAGSERSPAPGHHKHQPELLTTGLDAIAHKLANARPEIESPPVQTRPAPVRPGSAATWPMCGSGPVELLRQRQSTSVHVSPRPSPKASHQTCAGGASSRRKSGAIRCAAQKSSTISASKQQPLARILSFKITVRTTRLQPSVNVL